MLAAPTTAHAAARAAGTDRRFALPGDVYNATPPRIVFDPKNPAANEQGFVTMPNVNVVEEMVNMISASRAYQSNVEVMNTAKTLMQKTLALGQ